MLSENETYVVAADYKAESKIEFKSGNIKNNEFDIKSDTYNIGDSQNAGGLFNPIYIYNNSARGRTFIVSFEYKY